MKARIGLALTATLILATPWVACSSSAPVPAKQGSTQVHRCDTDGLALATANTTDGRTARQNLDAQIDGREQLVARRPRDIEARLALIDLLRTRVQFFATYDDFDTAFEHARWAVDQYPQKAQAHLALAKLLAGVHRFDDALASAATAQSLGADASALRGSVALARGEDLETWRKTREASARARPSFASHSAKAALQAATGDFEGADATYRDALTAYRDVSPFAVAWVEFQRGVMWSEMAERPDRGCALYTSGVTRLPGYVVAQTHLAEIEAESGNMTRAIARLRAIIPDTPDPEPMGLLGELLLARGESRDRAEAEGLIATAKARYDDLLARYPLAFADHAAEFFMGPGEDPARALELAMGNLDQRQNDRAFSIAIAAAKAAGEPALACKFARRAGSARASVGLRQTSAELLPSCPPAQQS